MRVESSILAERVHITPKCVSEQSTIAKFVSESRIQIERVYATPQSVSERSSIARCMSESKVLAERVYVKQKLQNVCLRTEF